MSCHANEGAGIAGDSLMNAAIIRPVDAADMNVRDQQLTMFLVRFALVCQSVRTVWFAPVGRSKCQHNEDLQDVD